MQHDIISLKDKAPVSELFEGLTGHSHNTLRKALGEVHFIKEKGEKVNQPFGNLKKLEEALSKIIIEIKRNYNQE
ncbi:MAG: hypothetical protein IIA45_03240 [Bacteroidetes bacterium]|nr:hypothetical protein [Bacteroidota bacterium]